MNLVSELEKYFKSRKIELQEHSFVYGSNMRTECNIMYSINGPLGQLTLYTSGKKYKSHNNTQYNFKTYIIKESKPETILSGWHDEISEEKMGQISTPDLLQIIKLKLEMKNVINFKNKLMQVKEK